MIDNVENASIRIVSYDPSWPSQFEGEKALLQEAIGEWVTGGIHHVGSTSVPGLAAKPIIDILIGVKDLPSSQPCIGKLLALDYKYAPYRAEEMHWLCKPDPAHRTHHLHLVPTDSHRYLAELRFRDLLRAQPERAEEYAKLKRVLAAQHTHDREAYTQAKADFIETSLIKS